MKKLTLLVVTIMFLSSCDGSFLDLTSKEATDGENAIVDIKSMEYATYGLYALAQNQHYYNRTFYFLPDLISDNVYLSTRTRTYYTELGKFRASANHSRSGSQWEQIYRVVVNSNFIIQKGSELEVPEGEMEEKEAMVGEAYAMRALAHFDLCRMYAQPYNYTEDASHMGIPLILESSLDVDELTFPGRNTVKEVYEAVVDDLKKAINKLSESVPGESSSFKGRITVNAAKALLSRVYLYMGEWEKSRDMATDVIDSEQYSLLPTNQFVDEYSTSNNSESIFEIINTYTDNSGSNSVDYYYNQDGYGDGLGTMDLYDSYSSSDVRRDFMEIGDRSGGGGEKDVPLVTKFRKKDGNFEQDVIVIRLAEVYLNRAEARAHLGEDSKAMDDLDTIAERSDPDVSIDQSLSGQSLIDRILLERRKELAFEGHRLFDLMRNKKNFTKYYTDGESTNVEYHDDKTILPIPESELDVNDNLDQNPGY